ncbi:DUF1996 domain-containing protein [Nonomuraea sp. NPDC000554]|uniref:DUF1996 domain-containing protein n=1 Tax=Nonomuraea sp. NPDC000554 TaxID=3154259 RepID=UPI0033203676
MRRSRRMAAAVSALAVAAGGLVSAAVIGVSPALADHCDPAQQGQEQQQRPQQQRQQDQQQQPQDQGQDQSQDQGQDQGQEQGQDQQQNGDQQQSQQQNRNGQQRTDDQRTDDQRIGDQRIGDQQGTQDQQRFQDPRQGPDEQAAPTQPPSDQEQFTPSDDPTQSFRTRNRGRGQRPTPSASPSPTASDDHNECADLGPFLKDFVDIRQVPANGNRDTFADRNGSRGTFVSACGTNRNGHNNPDNFIVAPGVSNGAHHLHDYVGNLSTNGFSTDESLAAAGTTCRFGDKSTYFWPVLRDRKVDANDTDPDGNVGQVVRARSVTLEFRGNAQSKVVAMPRFLRLLTGDAKAATNGGANARAQWTCTGFTNRISTDKYPLCPRFSQVVRILEFPSCWDGQNTDSANHRTHVVFPDQGGACPQGTRAIPQLQMILTYQVPQGPSYAVDAFPEQLHNPVTDHGDFANVMPDRLMAFVVNCINRGRRC